jgi:uncharacterized membrane protein
MRSLQHYRNFFLQCCQHIDKRPLTLVKPKLVHKLIQPGRIIFATGIIALGILQFFFRNYIVGRPPVLSWPVWAAALPGKLVWAYLSGAVLISAGLAVLFNKKAGLAAIIIGLVILIYSFLFRHLPAMTDWINSYKALALGGGAFIVAASFLKNGRSQTNDHLIFTGCIFFSLFFIICGIAHFKFDEFIYKDFIPAYIPARPFWTYLTAVALIAGGIGIIFTATRKWAAALSGLMILLWFVLLHIPRTVKVLNDSDPSNDLSDLMGVCESFTFSGILFVLAGLSSLKKTINPANNKNL